MLNNEYKFRDAFKEFNSLDNLKKLDTNKDGKVELKEIKKADIDNDGVISDSEFDKVGINSKVIQDELTSKLPNLKESSINPNQIVFKVKDIYKKINDLKPKNDNDLLYPSSMTLETKKEPNHRVSEEIHEKYLTIKSLLKDSKIFDKFNNVFNQIDSKDEKKINSFLDETIMKIPFNLDKDQLVLNSAKRNIPIIPDKNLSNFVVGFIPLAAQRLINSDTFRQTNNEEKIENRANLSSITKSGNCVEHASFSAIESKKLGAKRVEIFGLDIQSGHAFVVINRDKNSSPSEPTTWGKNCIIIDSWQDKAYKSTDYFKHMKIKPFVDFEM